MTFTKMNLVVALGLCCAVFTVEAVNKFANEPVTSSYDVEAVQGSVAKLPCDIEPSIAGDKMHIVIWFKESDSKREPIYSFDARDILLEKGKHWADESFLGGRGYFRYQDKPAKLTLDSVRDNDGGIYYCRVDFKQSPTRNIKVNLTIIIPPEKLSVLDESGAHIPDYVLGPYNEGSSINVTCVSTGGRPPPKVTWWQENALLDDSYEHLSERRVRNVLHLEKLERKHLHMVFTCQASNNNLVTPISSSITLDINLRPLWVKLLGDNKPLSAENTYELSCEVVGSRPEPTITWWKGSTQMKNTRETTSPDRNVTTSVLTFAPTVEDGGKYLSCRGQQPQIPDSGIEDGWKLDIYHVPLVSLELGSNLNSSVIKEGVDVYFECNIKSNPWVYKVSWRHNGKQLYNNVQANTIVSNQSLVLQSITRARSGLYTCVGHNQEGDGESNPVQLDVKFTPTCRPGQAKVFGVARHETVRIACELEANPTDVQFVWKFNNTSESYDIPQSQVQTEKARSYAYYKPITEMDYGTLLCWGRNEIGMQKEPCVFYINPAGKPDPPSNCTILNQTSDSLSVECSEGFDGGLRQQFVMEVYDAASGRLVGNVTARQPAFGVGGLDSGAGFKVNIYAANRKGRSPVMQLLAATLKSAEKHTAVVPMSEKPPPPENCTVLHQTRYYLSVGCYVSDMHRAYSNTYLLQAFDASSRLLLATATSRNPEEITVSDLPADYKDLLLFVRTMDGRSVASDANTIYVPAMAELKTGASTPVLLQITPLLGALIGVVAALILVAIIIVVVIRLRGGGDRGDKDYDDTEPANNSRRGVSGSNSDKASTEPLNKDLNSSTDSLEEKNPDIIPQNNAEDEYQDEERAFERLNNITIRSYSRIQSPNNQLKNESYMTKSDEITYAELSLANHQQPLSAAPAQMLYSQSQQTVPAQCIPMSVMRRPEPTVYAQLDVTRMRPPLAPAAAAFHALQRHLPMTYQTTPRLPRDDMHTMMAQQAHDGSVTSETPLLNQRDSNVLQSLLDVNTSRTPTITSTLPRTVTATRF